MIRMLLFMATALFSLTSPQVLAASDQTFWENLATGHKILLVRHANVADDGFGSPFILDDSCFSERNLSDFGREQARWINQQLKAHQIHLQAVMSSPHCRTKETAELLANGLQAVTINPVLRLTKAVTPALAEQNIAATRALMRDFQGKGILVLVTHRPNIGELIYHTLEPAEMAVVEPFEGDTFDVIARLKVPLTPQ